MFPCAIYHVSVAEHAFASQAAWSRTGTPEAVASTVKDFVQVTEGGDRSTASSCAQAVGNSLPITPKQLPLGLCVVDSSSHLALGSQGTSHGILTQSHHIPHSTPSPKSNPFTSPSSTYQLTSRNCPPPNPLLLSPPWCVDLSSTKRPQLRSGLYCTRPCPGELTSHPDKGRVSVPLCRCRTEAQKD